jgi:hypothetical protein
MRMWFNEKVPNVEMELTRVRQLHWSDRDTFIELLGEHLEDLEKKGVATKVFTFSVEEYLKSDSPQKAIFGYFNAEKRLMSTVGYRFWPTLPYATLNYMVARKRSGLFNSKKNGLVFCLHRCFEVGASSGIRAFYHLQKAKSFQSKLRTWRKFDTELTKRYYSVAELVIEANQRTPFSIAWDLMDKQTWPYETILWLTRLKPEYEKVINWGGEPRT